MCQEKKKINKKQICKQMCQDKQMVNLCDSRVRPNKTITKWLKKKPG